MHPTATQSLALAFGIGAAISLICVRLGVPAILPLLVAGIVLGRSGIGVIDSAALGEGLDAFISVAIGVLIFEGSLHLDRATLKRAPQAVWGMLTRGAIVSWAATAALAHWVVGMPWAPAFLVGAILIVTGPTVIQPILRRVRLSPSLHTTLASEAILIDPIGVIAAVAVLDFCLAMASGQGPGPEPAMGILWRYIRPLTAGVAVGIVVGLVARVVMNAVGKAQRSDSTHLNLLAMGACMLAVGIGEWAAPEAGLAASAVCGIILANTSVRGTRQMRLFNEQISIVLVGALFILLVSRLELDRVANVGPREALFVAGIVFVCRPLSVMIGTLGSSLSFRERVYASLIAPRGVVAASVASVAGAALTSAAEIDASGDALGSVGATLEQLVFQVILVTVVFASIAAWPLAWALRVLKGPPNEVLIVGAHALGIGIARTLRDLGVPVRVVDTNPVRVASARAENLPAFHGDATDLQWLEEQVLTPDVGWVLAWTGNDDVDRIVARWASGRLGPGRGVTWTPGKPVPPSDHVSIVGEAHALGDVVAEVTHHTRRVAIASGDSPIVIPVMIVSGKGVSPATENARANKPNPDAKVIGVT